MKLSHTLHCALSSALRVPARILRVENKILERENHALEVENKELRENQTPVYLPSASRCKGFLHF